MRGEEVGDAEFAAPALQLTPATETLLADALNVFSFEQKDATARQLLNDLLLASVGESRVPLARIAAHVPQEGLDDQVLTLANAGAVEGGKLSDSREAQKLVELFVGLRDIQRGQKTVSPLTPRVLADFFKFYIRLRQNHSQPAAAMRAAELALWSKLGSGLRKKANDKLLEVFGKSDEVAGELPFPRLTADGTWFGETLVKHGSRQARAPNEQRFPMQPVVNDKGEVVGASRVKDLSLIADAVEMGDGQPISATDDDNGETVELFREFGALTGRPVTVIDLPRDVDIGSLIEKLVLTDDPAVKGGFIPELQELAQAVRDGHILVLRGCGNIPSEKLELLNALADGRRYLEKPISRGEPLAAHKNTRLVFLRRPASPHHYSPAIENRVIEPQLSTRETELTDDTMERRIADLAVLINKRGGISWDLAERLATLHTILNQHMRLSTFSWSKVVGSFLNRDAEAVATRLKWLLDHNVADDPVELLHHLVQRVYGMRLDPPADRMLLEHISKQALRARGDKSIWLPSPA